ncbi:MAG TPA: heavy-metal-associated domain-containing protein [Casimicrobiaceae bacterium]|jgi:copper chaperone|nr:heavy-metal-associated domain-containing protein [Casimicrobiaceae bacterium]
MEKVTLNVQGMSCQGCVGSVTRVLKGTPGVQDVNVTLQPGRAEVTFDPARTNVAALRSAIEDAGYAAA